MHAPPVDLIAETELFRGVSPPVLEALAAAAGSRSAARGERLFMEGEPARRVGLVASGRLKLVQIAPDGREVILRVVGPGGLFGAVAVFEDACYPASAVVMEEAEVFTWTGSALRAAMASSPELALNALALLSTRLRRMQERVREMATERVERRIARALLRLVRHAGRRTDDCVEIDMPVTRQEIAELTGTTVFTVSRVLSAWEGSGLVRTGRQRVAITDPHGMVALAEDLPAEPRPPGGRQG